MNDPGGGGSGSGPARGTPPLMQLCSFLVSGFRFLVSGFGFQISEAGGTGLLRLGEPAGSRGNQLAVAGGTGGAGVVCRVFS